jgi:hypothetical protein
MVRGSRRLEDLPDLAVVGRRLMAKYQASPVDAPLARQRPRVELPPLPSLGPTRRAEKQGQEPAAAELVPRLSATALIDLDLSTSLAGPDDESESPEELLARLAHAALQATREQLNEKRPAPGLPIDLVVGVDPQTVAAVPDADRSSVAHIRHALASASEVAALPHRDAVRLSITHSGRHGVRQLGIPDDPAFDLILDLGCVRREVCVVPARDGSERWTARTVATLTASYDRNRVPDSTALPLLGTIRDALARRST